LYCLAKKKELYLFANASASMLFCQGEARIPLYLLLGKYVDSVVGNNCRTHINARKPQKRFKICFLSVFF